MEPLKIPITVGTLGIVRAAAVDEFSASPESVELAINLSFDKIGAVELRNGLTTLGAQISASPILGMSNYRNNAGTTYGLLAKVSSVVYNFNGSNWSSVRTGLSNTSKARFTNFLDLTYMVDGNAGSAVATFNGSIWSAVRTSLSSTSKARFTNFLDLTYMVDGNGGSAVATYDGSAFGSTNIGSLPKGDDIENYRSRIWVADSATDKVYYTDVVSTSQTISGGTSFIQVSPQDGEKITALKRYPDALLVFKQNHISRILSPTSADPDPRIFRGTYSKESIIETKSGLFYHHPTGFYKFVYSGDQEEISRPIIDVVEAISRANYENINGWADSDHCYWSVGDITLDGLAYANVVCRYTISTQVWTLYSYASEIKRSALYDDGTLLRLIVGDENGYPFVFDSGLTDNGTPIFYDLQTHPLYLTSTKMTEKEITEISAVHENAQGAYISHKADNGNWSKPLTITKDIVQAFTTSAKFKKIRLRFSGNSIGNSLIFRSWELLQVLITGTSKK